MGQRHQVYVRLPKKYYNPDNPNNKDAVTIGLHHQWLYGHTALRLLRNYLTFCKEDFKQQAICGDYSMGAMGILERCFSFDLDNTYYHGVHIFDGDNTECKDPRKGDNNNGITIIDLEDPKDIKYCFLSIGHLETLHPTVYEPDYYEEEDDKDIVDKTLTYKNFQPIDAETWVQLHYGKNWERRKPLDKKVREHIDFISKFKLLDVERLARIFPDMVSDIKGEGLYPISNSVQFIKGTKRRVKDKKVKKKTSAAQI